MKLYKQLGYILALAIGSTTANATVDLVNTLSGDSSGGRFNFPVGVDDRWAASQFSTGSSCPSGCTLGDVTLFLDSDDNAGSGHGPDPEGHITVEILADTSGTPGASIATLGNPEFIVFTVFENIFTAPSNITLADNTNYWVKITSDGGTADDVSWIYPGSGNGSPGKWVFKAGVFGTLEGDGTDGTHSAGMMRVEAVSNVPVPSAFWLLGTALLGLATRRSKKIA
jgi:hypothetical protein